MKNSKVLNLKNQVGGENNPEKYRNEKGWALFTFNRLLPGLVMKKAPHFISFI